jgi:Pup amidohydrolase
MRRILAGTDTEYGLLIEGRGAKTQVEDSQEFVESFQGEAFVGWDYRYENPRNDLRGFQLKNLAIDPNDAQFDIGKNYASSIELRADRALTNGGRFYNDHGHPEYSTPESFSIFELAKLDQEGESVVNRVREEFKLEASLYKNNTDYHGSSYGTHESYSVPRTHSAESIQAAVLPMLVVRQILTGSGKVGSESGEPVPFQLSQRADFFVETANAETLWRRPVFNTRDEPHADPEKWIRLHVISGDANMNPRCTALRVGLVKLALHLLDADLVPKWEIANPVKAFQSISRDYDGEFRIDLKNSWTTAFEIFESYFAAAGQLELDDEMQWVIHFSRSLIESFRTNQILFKQNVDWATKLDLLESIRLDEGYEWGDPILQSIDLEYSNINPGEGLFFALGDRVETSLPEFVSERSRAFARGLAIQNFRSNLTKVGWRGITFGDEFVELLPDATYPEILAEVTDVETFIRTLKGIQ